MTATFSYTGSAISGTDYQLLPGEETLPPDPTTNRVVLADDEVNTNFIVQTVDDSGDEDDETITLYLNETSGTIFRFTTPAKYWTSGFAFDTGSLFDTPLTDTVTIIDNESGSADFLATSASVVQNSSVVIAVERVTGMDIAATATIDQYSGTATQDVDYIGLPASVYWEAQESGSKTFTITTINAWTETAAMTVGMYFSSLINIDRGTNIPTEELTITNSIISSSVSTIEPVSSDYTINIFRRMSAGYKSENVCIIRTIL